MKCKETLLRTESSSMGTSPYIWLRIYGRRHITSLVEAAQDQSNLRAAVEYWDSHSAGLKWLCVFFPPSCQWKPDRCFEEDIIVSVHVTFWPNISRRPLLLYCMLLWRQVTVPLSASTSVEEETHKTAFAHCLFYLRHVQKIVFSYNCYSSLTMTSNLLFPL